MVEQKLERPMALKLIIAYNIFHILFILYTISIGYEGFIGLLYIFAIYYGLWKMRKDWMWVFVFILAVSTAYYVYSMFAFPNVFSMIFAILHSISIYWIYTNRNIFKEPEKGSTLGTRSEWIRVGIIFLGIIGILILFGIITTDYILYGVLAIPIWVIFVWFLLPRLIEI